MEKLVKRLLSKVSLRHIVSKVRQIIPTLQEFRDLGGCFKHPREISQWWSRLSTDRRRFFLNLMIGLGILFLLQIFHNAPVLRESEDAAMDWVMRMRKCTVSNEPTFPFGWIDIDDETYRDWKEPLYVPREKLAKLIEFAVESRPKMVVVDVDLAQRSGDETLENPIKDVLKKKYGDKCQCERPFSEGCPPPLILVASLRPSKEALLEKRLSNLDDLVEKSDHIFWASPLFDKDWDQSIRRWRMWEPIWPNKKVDAVPTSLPSIQLLAATLLTSGEEEMGKLQRCLNSLALKGHNTMAGQPVSNDEKPCTVTLWNRQGMKLTRKKQTLSLSWERLGRRFLYSIPWQAEGSSGMTIPTVRTTEDQKRLLLTRISALQMRNKQRLADLQGRVVFIGGSFRDGRDIYPSPLGEMPGVLILINSLNSLLQQKTHLPYFFIIIFIKEILLIVLLTIVFSVWDSFWGMIITNLTIIVSLVPVSVWLFGYGFWLDFALPLAAIQIHQLAADFNEGRERRRTNCNANSPPQGENFDN
ncbi:CHASE2 domain-containing protein [Desulfobacter curvatus]|uniref:CHASE2 domain-containing protein n=1 Tax=Desulfobacter curvatus TaxID=2290 RepID=UPI000377E6A2|nr:CHASE2 domain-containing protein [Desulfobacter curvatus]